MQNTIKKCLSLLLACLMIMSIATVAFADGGTLTVGTDSGKAGEDVVIPVTLNADGVTSGVFKISYNKDVLTYKSAATATFDASSTVDGTTAGTVKFAFANSSAAVATDKPLITVTFTINAGTAAGTYSNAVSAVLEEADAEHHLKADGFFDANGDAVAVDITAGSVTVEAAAVEIKYGDVNNDGSITADDYILLARVVGKWRGYTTNSINADAADVNCDGAITADDYIILARYVGRWRGYSALPYLK